jgi:hypothetical protein
MKPNNDELVAASEFLWRRTYFDPIHKYFNPNGSPTSRAFKLREKDNGQLSVEVKSLSSPEKSVGDANKFMLLELSAQAVYDLDLFAQYDPLPENPAHAYIGGMELEDDLKPKLLAEKAYKIFP